MGTFQAKYTRISSSGDAFDGGITGYRTNNFPSAGNKTGQATFSCSQLTGFALDGNPFGPPPAGFTADGASMGPFGAFGAVQVNGSSASPADSRLDVSWLLMNNAVTFIEKTFVSQGVSLFIPTFASVVFFPNDFTSSVTFDLHAEWGAGSLSNSVQVLAANGTEFLIAGNYTIFAFSWTFAQDGDSVSPGDLITITSGTNPLTDMDLSHVTISLPCGVVVPIVQTPTLYTFLVPDSCDGALTEILTATGDGTQFSGSVALGTLNILLVNGSGIYTLVTGQRHDELYSNLRNGTTINVKIPNPTARTGFVGG